MNPLTGIYAAATRLNNNLFDRGLFRSRPLARPVISVGNLSTGGSGKTPFVIALGELFKARGISFDVLSRGYRRKTRDVLVVEPSGNAGDFGDEPLLISRRLGVPVIVGNSRYEAGMLAEREFDSQFHILDDGFQHRSLARDFDIVLMTGDESKDRLLPSGRLREPLSSLARADVIVLPAELPDADLPDHEALHGKLIWRMKRHVTVPNAPQSAVAFCGIARPEQFFRQVRAAGVTPIEETVFRDHHTYQPRDITHLLVAKERLGAGGFVTTEKDAINLGALGVELRPLALATLTVSLENASDAIDTILARTNLARTRE
ncbi:MAG: tetraacyldisaccharide 4'-kinase [Terriglobales bacterium]|jgi:tetraacyldisaccharide 4'-kinase